MSDTLEALVAIGAVVGNYLVASGKRAGWWVFAGSNMAGFVWAVDAKAHWLALMYVCFMVGVVKALWPK